MENEFIDRAGFERRKARYASGRNDEVEKGVSVELVSQRRVFVPEMRDERHNKTFPRHWALIEEVRVNVEGVFTHVGSMTFVVMEGVPYPVRSVAVTGYGWIVYYIERGRDRCFVEPYSLIYTCVDEKEATLGG